MRMITDHAKLKQIAKGLSLFNRSPFTEEPTFRISDDSMGLVMQFEGLSPLPFIVHEDDDNLYMVFSSGLMQAISKQAFMAGTN